MTQESPIVRAAARVVLFDREGRVLLFRAAMPDRPERPFWITPGGGLHPGETEAEAARREVWEETGLQDVELGPCVWVRKHVFAWQGTWLEQRESYFYARVPGFEVDTTNHEDLERQFLSGHRWWTLEEMAASDERFVPGDFVALARPLVDGRFPPEPIVVGI